MNSIYKNSPENYPDWEKYNPTIGHGQLGRFKTEILTCLNENCERHNQEISEDESFYLFAKQSFFKRLKPVFLPSRTMSLYVCPFCGKCDTLHPANNDIQTW